MLRQQVEALKNAPAEQQSQPQVQQAPAQQESPQSRAATQVNGERLIVTTSAEASRAAQRLVQMAEKVVTEAEDDADKIREDARREAHQITTDARTRAERSESEARVLADRVSAEAKARADQMDRELANRRTELFSRLESERDQLNDSVQKLRDFESTYRTNITNHLKGQLSTLDETATFEPEDRPDGLPAADDRSAQNQGPRAEPSPADEDDDDDKTVRLTSTPRLDALLGDNRG